jgi:ribosome-binding protein aMBF1 (putative translation factor)
VKDPNIPIWNISDAQLLSVGMSMRKSIYSEEHEHLVSRLKEARKQAGLTQKQVAERLGIGQSVVSKIESGQYRVDVIQLSQFAKLYKKDLKFFIK